MLENQNRLPLITFSQRTKLGLVTLKDPKTLGKLRFGAACCKRVTGELENTVLIKEVYVENGVSSLSCLKRNKIIN